MSGNTVVNLPGAADMAILEDDAGAVANVSQIRSQNGVPTFDTTTFTTPTSSLRVNMGAADGGALTVDSMDPAFNAALIIDGQRGGADAVKFTGSNANLSAMTVTVTGAISDSAGTTLGVTGNANFIPATFSIAVAAAVVNSVAICWAATLASAAIWANCF